MKSDEDLFKPLSAKVGRKQWSSGGKEQIAGRARMGDGNRVRQALLRAQKDAERRAKGTLKANAYTSEPPLPGRKKNGPP